ncbi:MAG: DNA/RNA non-specific endonuclease [Coriobacteriia bacterium]|nr:DNA/RNA non-specific endonuclease [Coriobacteriia bacterium]
MPTRTAFPRRTRVRRTALALLLATLLAALLCVGCGGGSDDDAPTLDPAQLPAFSGSPSVNVNDGQPAFSDAERNTKPGTERYGKLDALGRCTATFALVGPETMPTEEREPISEVRPTGWGVAPYDFIDGGYLYNRCHLLGYQLTGENANERNLITGTRYLNIQGMLPYENQVAAYVRSTGNHVLMRVTPVFEGRNLLPSGVQMEAESLEDQGAGVRYNVYCYNVQPGVHIEYDDGSNWVDDQDAAQAGGGSPWSGENAGSTAAPSGNGSGAAAQPAADELTQDARDGVTYVMNINTQRFHSPGCGSVQATKPKNTRYFYGDRDRALELGFQPCGNCNP